MRLLAFLSVRFARLDTTSKVTSVKIALRRTVVTVRIMSVLCAKVEIKWILMGIVVKVGFRLLQ